MKESGRIHISHGDTIGGRSKYVTQASASVRVSPHSYFIALLLGTFSSSFFFYLELDLVAVVLFGLAWILVPTLALNDRIIFDGKRLLRTGVAPVLWSRMNSSRRGLRLNDIEQIETHANRAMKRGRNIFYRYKMVVRGKGLSISIVSGGEGFRKMVRCILSELPDNVLDNRSRELRDHLADPKETLMKAEFSRIPSVDVLDTSLRASSGRRPVHRSINIDGGPEEEKAEDLRILANELRMSGYLLQAIEAFRRALVLRPADARLLFDFARCLHSLAGVERDGKLERRALAALRLSERRADGDGDLLVRLGEWYFQIGEWGRAGNLFQTALDRFGENFRTARGLAEIALREGKIAHVIHHFYTANRLADTPALRRWARTEAEYFSNLHSNDEYMELEIGRVSLLETVEKAKRTSFHLACLGFPAIIVGLVFEDSLVANAGWAISSISLLIWTGLSITTNLLAQRIPFEMVGSDEV